MTTELTFAALELALSLNKFNNCSSNKFRIITSSFVKPKEKLLLLPFLNHSNEEINSPSSTGFKATVLFLSKQAKKHSHEYRVALLNFALYRKYLLDSFNKIILALALSTDSCEKLCCSRYLLVILEEVTFLIKCFYLMYNKISQLYPRKPFVNWKILKCLCPDLILA